MKFSHDGENTIRCIISEEEILDLGYSLDDLLQNKGRSQDFMNEIFDRAEQELGLTLDKGIKTVRAEFRPDHTLCISFSKDVKKEKSFEDFVEMVKGILDSTKVKPEAVEETENSDSKEEESYDYCEDVVVLFGTIEEVAKYAKLIPSTVHVPNSLYKFEDIYYLRYDFRDSEGYDICMDRANEFAIGYEEGLARVSYVVEHGKEIFAENAIETLAQL